MAWLLVPAALALPGCAPDAETALARGDRLWADSQYVAALAEYRLAARQREGDPVALARVAHGFARTGQFARAHENYEALLRVAPEYADQALFDYVTLAREAQERSDRYGMASALEAALVIRPGLQVGGLAAPLARFYAARGEPERALAFYERALAGAEPDSVGVLLYELAELHEARGDCRAAMGYYNAYRERAPRAERVEQARWQVGACAWRLAQEARAEEDTELALRHLETLIEMGVPENLLDQAWFARGEILAELGLTAAALDAFTRVVELDRGRGGRLSEEARERIDRIRFGRGRGR